METLRPIIGLEIEERAPCAEGGPMDSVVVCDTEPIAMEGLRSLLESAEGLRVVAAETSLAGGMEAVRELQPAVLVVDKVLRHPSRDGVSQDPAGRGVPHSGGGMERGAVGGRSVAVAASRRRGSGSQDRPAGDAAGVHPAGGGRKHLDGRRTDCQTGPADAHGPPGAHGAGAAGNGTGGARDEEQRYRRSHWASAPARSRFT